MTQNDYDLQLFADIEGGAEAAAPETQPDVKPDFAIHVDETGTRRAIPVSPDAGMQAPVAGGTTSPYSANDLLLAMGRGDVDESRIPQELAGQYQAAMLRQQLNQAQAQQNAMARQPQQPVPPAPEQPKPQEIYAKLHELAVAKAQEDMGLTSSDLSELEETASYSDDDDSEAKKKLAEYNAAVQLNQMALISDAQRRQEMAVRQQQEREAVWAEITPEINEYKKDPNFAVIDQMLNTHYQNLPYNQAIVVKDILDRWQNNGPVSRNDIAPFRDYYKATREAYYAKVSGVSSQPVHARPPMVESPGTTAKQAPQPVNWAAMRNMDARERSEFLRKHI